MLELGNIVNHYLITPSSAENKDVHFTEVFSPGLKFLVNIKNTPLVAYAGSSLLPLKTYDSMEAKKKGI
ncbi:hypothetical protein KUH03_30800 [Sphingobacterium sp. E70]|uniref:hypothetical protein n=1 Tax=Sphingobacterium sp. E70 TaxID=2853439 RepID=UPI00211C1008|nr:hypothetical protein [Sphingobacterium sp. E70]ULT23526.1 hypothetical protein KUH03_30800 [Sphingobacterium sp. E70]